MNTWLYIISAVAVGSAIGGVVTSVWHRFHPAKPTEEPKVTRYTK